MLVAWGPYRFTVPTYSVETIRSAVQPRVEAQPVIGAIPTIHRLGPGNEQLTLQSTFFPQQLNGNGLSQLSGIKSAINALRPMMLSHANGTVPNVFGLWIGTGLENEQTTFDPSGSPSQVTTTLTLMQYGGVAAGARASAMDFIARSSNSKSSIDFGDSGISVNIQVGF